MLAAMRLVGDVPEVAVMIDDDPANYAEVPWPEHWHIHVAPEHLEMTRAINALHAAYPGRSSYGFFGDHLRIVTPMFAKLAEAAGDWFVTWPMDVDKSHFPYGPSGVVTIGGKLVDIFGWICLPTTVHCSTERPWWVLWRDLGLAKILDDCLFDRTWPIGRDHQAVRPAYNGEKFETPDSLAFWKWEANERPGLIERVREGMIADGFRFNGSGRISASRYGATNYVQGNF